MHEAFDRILWRDWRVKLVIGAVAVAAMATLAFWIFVEDATNASKFEGAFFASWISGLLLFLVVGSVVAIVSLARPEQELFDARARNLLRRQEGSHIDYIISKFHDLLEAYVASSEKRIIILDYHEAEGKIYTSQTTTNRLQGYLDDKEVTVKSKIAYENATLPPPGKPRSSLSYLKLDGEAVGEAEEFSDSFKRDFIAIVAPRATCSIEHRLLYWVKAGEEANRHRPIRYTKKMLVHIENQLASRPVAAMCRHPDGTVTRYTIAAGASETIINLAEIAPRDTIYDFVLEVP